MWFSHGPTLRVAGPLLVVSSAAWLTCSHGLKTSPKDAGAESTPDAADEGAAGARLDAIADESLSETGGLKPCPDTSNCGTLTVSTERRPADVLLVLDRSGSMKRSLTADCLCTAGPGDDPASICPDAVGCTDRWTTVKSALDQLVGGRLDLQWGIEVFPSPADSTCLVSGKPQVPIAADSRTMVQAELDAVSPSGNTPLAAALDTATAYLSALADGNVKVILLATDGVAECTEGQPSPSTDAMAATLAASAAAKQAGFPVYVLGAGPAVSALDDLAKAGGTGTHYPATSPDLLSNVIDIVSRTVMTCTLTFQAPPPDPDNVVVYLDKQMVPRDPSNGWTYDPTSAGIVLAGTYCDELLTAQSTKVQVLFGCPGMPPPVCIP